MKKFASLLLAVLLVLTLAVPAFATTLTITEPTGAEDATYAGYKILNSTNSADKPLLFAYTLNDKYTDVLLGVINGETDEEDEDYIGADGIIDYIAALKDNADDMRTFANNVYAAIKAANLAADKALATGDNTVDEGYWLIAQTSAAGELETQSLVIVDTAGKEALTIESKKDTFTVEKKVTDESQFICIKDQPTIKNDKGEDVENPAYDANHVHTAACWDWTKTNESPVGATVKFQIATSVPANMAGYKYNAYFIVGDILSQGLTLDKNSIEVYIDGTKAATTAYTVRYSDSTPACESGYTFQVALVDPKANAGKDVVVYYSAKVNENAKLKLTGNPNEADVTYNPDSNVDYGGSSDGGFPKDTTTTVNGKTPKSFTITYATGIQFQKVDGNKLALAGAEFTVTGTTETTELKWVQEYVKVAEGETGTFYLLTNGEYTDVAPVADKMEAQTKDGTFEGGYVEVISTEAYDLEFGGKYYRYATQADFDNESTTIYTLVEGTEDDYAETTPSYKYVEHWVSQTSTKNLNTTVAVDDNGIANLPGLAAGTYHVTESVVPDGYNKIDDFDIVVTWTAPTATELAKGKDAQCTWTAKVGDKTLSLTTVNDLWDLFGLQVINESGTELPSTGGIGTTIFYVVGGILLAGAAVLLITKKRMSVKD